MPDPTGPICSIGCSELDVVHLRRWAGPGATGPIVSREVPAVQAWAAPELLAALDKLPSWLAQRGCNLLLPTEDPRDSERPPFLDAAIAAARGG